MLGKCFFALTSLSVAAAAYTGRLGELSDAVLEGAGRGVTLSVSLLGMMCLWCGLIEVFRDAGAVTGLARMIAPLMKRVFPTAFESDVASEEITCAVAANLLGVANAATPFALAAMEKLDAANPTPDRASDDMTTLAVLGTSCLDLMPTTVVTLLHSAGCAAPYAVIVPTWLCSGTCMAFGLLLCRLTRRRR